MRSFKVCWRGSFLLHLYGVSFTCDNVVKALAYVEIDDAELKNVTKIQSELLLELIFLISKHKKDPKVWMSLFKANVSELKGALLFWLKGHCESGLITVNVHVLNHLSHDLKKFHSIQL